MRARGLLLPEQAEEVASQILRQVNPYSRWMGYRTRHKLSGSYCTTLRKTIMKQAI